MNDLVHIVDRLLWGIPFTDHLIISYVSLTRRNCSLIWLVASLDCVLTGDSMTDAQLIVRELTYGQVCRLCVFYKSYRCVVKVCFMLYRSSGPVNDEAFFSAGL